MNKTHIMYAHEYPSRNSPTGKEFRHLSHRHQMMHIYDANHPVTRVRVTERHDLPLPGDTRAPVYIGWIRNDTAGNLTMIQTCLVLFNIQFPYGYEGAMQAGQGKAIVVEIEIDPEISSSES